MTVYWIQHAVRGNYAVNRQFVIGGTPRLYGSAASAQRIINGADGFKRSRMKDAYVVEGELNVRST